jgi:hypothetical protein
MAKDAKAAALEKARLLINLATNHAATSDEARTAAVQALKLLNQHGLLDTLGQPLPGVVQQPAPAPAPAPEPKKAPPKKKGGPQRYEAPARWAGQAPVYATPRQPRAFYDPPPQPRRPPPPPPPPPPQPQVQHDDQWVFEEVEGFYQPVAPVAVAARGFYTRVAGSHIETRSERTNRPARGTRMTAPRNDICRKCGGDVWAGSSEIVWVTNWGPVHLRCADR